MNDAAYFLVRDELKLAKHLSGGEALKREFGGDMRAILLAVSLALLSGCVTNVTFPSAQYATRNTPPQKVIGYLAKPAGPGPFPAVILLHDCGGLTQSEKDDWPAYFTANGYATLAIDTFGSRNAGRCPGAYGLGTAMIPDAYGGLDYLASLPEIDASRVAAMGFSLGAFAIPAFTGDGSTMQSPGGRSFRAGVAVYGSCAVSAPPKIPLLQIIGDKDYNSKACPKQAIPNLTTSIIAGATHGFDDPSLARMQIVTGGHAAIYSRAATNEAHELALRFLNHNMQ